MPGAPASASGRPVTSSSARPASAGTSARSPVSRTAKIIATADITDRMARFDNLAAACRQHLADQAAIAQARQAAAAADAVLGASATGPAPPLTPPPRSPNAPPTCLPPTGSCGATSRRRTL
jgi:hypothetical protein